MVGYLKLKTNDEELHETDYLIKLQNSTSKFSKCQYHMCKYFYKFIVLIKYYCNIITVKKIQDALVFILPFGKSNISEIKLKRCMKSLKKLINKYNIESIVFSEEIKYENMFNECNKRVCVIDGRYIMKYLIKEILEYILNKQSKKMQLEDLYICANENKQIYIENIMYLIHCFKTVNIVTNNINVFQKLSDKIEENENIFITVTNNKKKSLKKAKFIVNFDFTEKEIKKYTIYRNSILLTMNENGFYENIGFDGIQIRNIGIDISNEIKEFFAQYNLLETCSLNTLYESLINKKQDFNFIRKKMQKDKVKVVKLYGRNGEINDKEIIRISN